MGWRYQASTKIASHPLVTGFHPYLEIKPVGSSDTDIELVFTTLIIDDWAILRIAEQTSVPGKAQASLARAGGEVRFPLGVFRALLTHLYRLMQALLYLWILGR